MKKTLMSIVMLTAVLSASAQLSLNANGEYELKVTEQYSGASAKTLYENTLVALSDITSTYFCNSSLQILNAGKGFDDSRLTLMGISKFLNLDVADKDAYLIVSKGSFLIDYSHSTGYSVNYVLKIRCKDGRVQYIITIPSISVNSEAATVAGTVPLKYLFDNTLKGLAAKSVTALREKLAPHIEPFVKSFQQDIVKQTKVALANDF